MNRVCEKCGAPSFRKDERFCKECRKAVLAELRTSGFLAPILPHSGYKRTPDHKENTYETKHGTQGS